MERLKDSYCSIIIITEEHVGVLSSETAHIIRNILFTASLWFEKKIRFDQYSSGLTKICPVSIHHYQFFLMGPSKTLKTSILFLFLVFIMVKKMRFDLLDSLILTEIHCSLFHHSLRKF